VTITGRRWTRPPKTHPEWCDVPRCQALSLSGEHRSEPIRRHVPDLGVVVATLTQIPGRRVRLDVTLSAPLPSDHRAALRAEVVADQLAAALTQIAGTPRRAPELPASAPRRANPLTSNARPARAIAR